MMAKPSFHAIRLVAGKVGLMVKLGDFVSSVEKSNTFEFTRHRMCGTEEKKIAKEHK